MDAFSLMGIQAGRAAVGDLFEQEVDLSSAGQRGGVEQTAGCRLA
jgi:hypothetical protein